MDQAKFILEQHGRTSSIHVHSLFSDGRASPADLARAALELGLDRLGFSEHAPVPFPADWTMRSEDLPAYMAEICRLQEQYRGRLEILAGLEIDYVAGIMGPDSFAACNLDYTIGAVHFLQAGGGWLEIDDTPEKLQTIVATSFGGDARKAVAAYFAAVRGMLQCQPPVILAHIDLIKKFNRQTGIIDEDAAWYRREVFSTLEVLAAAGTILEVNTAPLYRGFAAEPYPSAFVLKRARKLGIPVIITADAHAPEFLAAAYPETIALLNSCGYSVQKKIEKVKT